jgi:hypothetical protein
MVKQQPHDGSPRPAKPRPPRKRLVHIGSRCVAASDPEAVCDALCVATECFVRSILAAHPDVDAELIRSIIPRFSSSLIYAFLEQATSADLRELAPELLCVAVCVHADEIINHAMARIEESKKLAQPAMLN